MALKIKEIRSMGKADLNEKLLESKKELMKVYAQVATGTTPKSPGQARALKQTIARILTVLNEKKEDKVKKDE